MQVLALAGGGEPGTVRDIDFFQQAAARHRDLARLVGQADPGIVGIGCLHAVEHGALDAGGHLAVRDLVALGHQLHFTVALEHALVELVGGLEGQLGQAAPDVRFRLPGRAVAHELQHHEGEQQHGGGHGDGQRGRQRDTVEAKL